MTDVTGLGSPTAAPARATGFGSPSPAFAPIIPGVNWPILPPAQSSQTPVSTLNRTARKHSAQQATVAAEGALLILPYGRVRVGAKIAGFTATTNRNIHLIAVWGQGEIDAIESISVDDAAPDSRFTFTHYTGTASQSPDLDLVAAYLENGVNFADAMAGVAYTHVVMQHRRADDHFPRLAAILRGLKVSSTDGGGKSWSDNPAYIIADFITNSYYGMGALVDWDTVADVAATCDELVGDIQERRRILNLSIDNSQDCQTWLQVLRDYAGCWIVPEGGKYRLIPDRPVDLTSVPSFDRTNIVAGSFKFTKRGIRTVPTAVQVSYTETGALPWREATDPTYAPGVLGGNTPFRRSQIAKPGITRKSEAHRYGIERLNEGTLGDVSVSATLFDEGIQIQVGDVAKFSDTVYMPTVTPFRLTKVDPVDIARWQVSGTKYDPAKYNNTAITGDPPPVGGPPPIGPQFFSYTYVTTTVLTNMQMFLDYLNRPYWVTSFGGDTWNALFPDVMSEYTNPIDSYHSSGTSELTTDHANFGSPLTGTWTAQMQYRGVGPAGTFLTARFGISLDDSTFVPHALPGGITATGQYAYNNVSSDGTLLVTGLGNVRVNIQTVREQGQIVTAASGPTTILLSGKYSTAIGAQMTPTGTNSRTGTVDRILVNPTASGVLQYDSFITGFAGNEFIEIAGLSYSVASGDRLIYEVLIPGNSPKLDGIGGFDMFDASGIGGNSMTSAGCTDQNSEVPRLFTSSLANGVWYQRIFDLTPLDGVNLITACIVDYTGVAGNHVALYRNVRIVNSSFVTQVSIYAGPGEPSASTIFQATSADPGIVGQANAFDVYLFDSATQAQVAGPGVWTFDGAP